MGSTAHFAVMQQLWASRLHIQTPSENSSVHPIFNLASRADHITPACASKSRFWQ